MKKLSPKEKLFCLLLARTGNGRESAVEAGYPMPKSTAARLMAREEIISETAAQRKADLVSREEVCAGYRRLAFGSVSDALKLLREEEFPTDNTLEKLDMFNVSDIKKGKNGIEIKFFDRLKALESLMEISEAQSGANGMLPFYEALEKGADALNEVISN